MFSLIRSLEWTGFPRRAALAVAVLGLCVLIGWVLDITLFKSVFPGVISMKANTALCFMLVGAALFFRLQASVWQLTASALACVAVLIAVASLGEYVFSWQLGIDQLLFLDSSNFPATAIPGRMSIYTAIAFCASGLSLLALPNVNMRRSVQIAAGATLLIGVVSLLAYLWNISAIIDGSRFTPLAPHTALGFTLLAIVLLNLTRSNTPENAFKTVERKILLGFASSVLLIVLAGGLTYRASASYSNAAQWVAHTQEVRAALSDLYSSISDAESSQRAYLITGDREQHAAHLQQVDAVSIELAELAALIHDNSLQLDNLNTLRTLISRRLEILKQVMQMYETQNLAAARREIVNSHSLTLMHNIHTLTDAMDTVEAQLLKQREADTEYNRLIAMAFMLITVLLAIIAMTQLFIAIRREIRLRLATQAKSTRELELRVEERTVALTVERDKLAAVFANTAIGLVFSNGQGGELVMNAAALKFHDFNSIDDMHRRLEDYAADWELHYSDERLMPFEEWPLARAVRGEYVQNLEVHSRHLQSNYQWIGSYTSVPVRNRAGEVILIVMTQLDITQQKRAEQEIHQLNKHLEKRVIERTAELQIALTTLGESEENLSVTLDSIGDAVLATDVNGRVKRLNRVAEQLTGWTQSAAVGRPVAEIMRMVNQTSRQTVINPVDLVLATGEPQGLANHTVLIARDGAEYCIADSCAAIHHNDGVIIGAVLVFRDVTEEYASQALLRDSSAHINAILNTIVDGIITIDDGGLIETVNPAVEGIFGYAATQLIGQNIKMLMPEPYRSHHDGYLENSRSKREIPLIGMEREVMGQRQDGSIFPLEIGINEMIQSGQRHFVGIVRDATARKQMEAMLYQAKEAAELANTSKDAFLANMSHELRTPLNAVIGFSEALKDGLVGEMTDQQREYIGDIYTSGQHLLSLINDILDLAKIESGNMGLDLNLVSIASVLHNSLSMVKEKALAHRLKLVMQMDNEIPEFMADQRKLKQIVYNLLSNAVKFTPDGGSVTLSAQRVDDMLEVAVSDTGIGISDDDQLRLFKPFIQIDSKLSRMYQGTGLGLVMIKRLAELHGGSVGVESTPGKGSRFWVRIPLTQKIEAKHG